MSGLIAAEAGAGTDLRTSLRLGAELGATEIGTAKRRVAPADEQALFNKE
jgi:hypothetical protein